MRPGILVPLLLPLLATSGERPEPELPVPEVEVVVRRGRARVVQGREIRSRSHREPALGMRGPFHVELGIRSEVEVAWRGRSSLRVRGPASFGIEPGSEPLEPRIAFFFLESLEVEVRRGAPQLDLPRGWSVVLAPGALGVRELPAGDLELVHHGGAPIAVKSLRERPAGWPTRLTSGSRVRLVDRER